MPSTYQIRARDKYLERDKELKAKVKEDIGWGVQTNDMHCASWGLSLLSN